MAHLENNKLSLHELKERLEFFEGIVNSLPIGVYLNEVDHGGDVSTMRCIWANQWTLDFIGYEQEEMTNLGSEIVKLVFHPDDVETAPKSLEMLTNNKKGVYFSIYRQKPKYKEEYQWIYSRTTVFKTYPDGSPRQSLNVAFELHNELHSPSQLIALLKENACLKNHLKLKSLTKREHEIMKLISEGLTDKAIGVKLYISPATAKTHRNKILKKLGLKNSAGLAAMAVECGI